MKKRLAILGSTGSIGTKALEVARRFPERFPVSALGAGRNVSLLSDQIREFHPEIAVVQDKKSAEALKQLLGNNCVDVLWGEEGYIRAAALESADLVVSAIVGAAGLLPTLAALDAGKPVALANKETLVMAGGIVMQRSADKKAPVLAIDSEHSALFQCMDGRARPEVTALVLTASGGPFRTRPANTFGEILPEDALVHPTWSMGKKITIDSATMMNKGLEVIEARWLFDVPVSRIRVVVHPESVVHSLVELCDGTVLAQMGRPDMLPAVAYALSYPERLPLGTVAPDLSAMGRLTFSEPDLERFPCIGLAYRACEAGKTFPAVLNAANEVAVQAFLDRRITFTRIPEIIERALSAHVPERDFSLESVLAADAWARKKAVELADGN